MINYSKNTGKSIDSKIVKGRRYVNQPDAPLHPSLAVEKKS
jgi:hypothetical protein